MSDASLDSHHALDHAARAVGRLDGVLADHPLYTGWLFRARFDAAVAHAAVDGWRIDRHQLAALHAGLRLRFHARDYGALSYGLRQMALLADEAPDQDEANGVDGHPFADVLQRRSRAESFLVRHARHHASLLDVGRGLWRWMTDHHDQEAARAAVHRALTYLGITTRPYPALAGAAAFGTPEANHEQAWLIAWLHALEQEAEDARRHLVTLVHAWRRARGRLGRRRADSNLPVALDALALVGVLAPVRLASGLAISVRSAGMLLDELEAIGAAVELTGRRTRRLYGLPDLETVRFEVAAPRKPRAGARGRPPSGPRRNGHRCEGRRSSGPAFTGLGTSAIDQVGRGASSGQPGSADLGDR